MNAWDIRKKIQDVDQRKASLTQTMLGAQEQYLKFEKEALMLDGERRALSGLLAEAEERDKATEELEDRFEAQKCSEERDVSEQG